MRAMLPRLFFAHFRSTSFLAESEGRPVGFLAGFHSPSRPTVGYVHFLGVDPAYRRRGVGAALYGKFAEGARSEGRTEIWAITSPVNRSSVRFHQQLGFEVVPGDRELDRIAVHSDYDGPGEDRVPLRRKLGSGRHD